MTGQAADPWSVRFVLDHTRDLLVPTARKFLGALVSLDRIGSALLVLMDGLCVGRRRHQNRSGKVKPHCGLSPTKNKRRKKKRHLMHLLKGIGADATAVPKGPKALTQMHASTETHNKA